MLYKSIILSLSVLFIVSCGQKADSQSDKEAVQSEDMSEMLTAKPGESVMTVAGGCFWCTEAVYERIKGVDRVISGYSGGKEKNPGYREVASGATSHAESIQVYYNPEVVSFETLMDVFFKAAHNPTHLNRQGPDKGKQYRSIAFYRNTQEKNIIEKKIAEVNSQDIYSDDIVTKVEKFEKFYPAEEYHQDYLKKNPNAGAYVRSYTIPKVEKFMKKFPDILKEKYTVKK